MGLTLVHCIFPQYTKWFFCVRPFFFFCVSKTISISVLFLFFLVFVVEIVFFRPQNNNCVQRKMNSFDIGNPQNNWLNMCACVRKFDGKFCGKTVYSTRKKSYFFTRPFFSAFICCLKPQGISIKEMERMKEWKKWT